MITKMNLDADGDNRISKEDPRHASNTPASPGLGSVRTSFSNFFMRAPTANALSRQAGVERALRNLSRQANSVILFLRTELARRPLRTACFAASSLSRNIALTVEACRGLAKLEPCMPELRTCAKQKSDQGIQSSATVDLWRSEGWMPSPRMLRSSTHSYQSRRQPRPC